MANKQHRPSSVADLPLGQVDPIAIAALFAIFATAVKIVDAIVEGGRYAPENRDLQHRFRDIRNELLNLQNSLDDFVLLIERYIHDSNNPEIGEKKLTISGTLLVLRERNFQRWRCIQDAIQQIDQRIYCVVKEIRTVILDVMFEEQPEPPIDTALIRQFDSLILEMGSMTFGDFIARLRQLLDSLSAELAHLAHLKRRSQ